MMRLNYGLLLAGFVLAIGCSRQDSPQAGPQTRDEIKNDPAALAEGKKYLLSQEPAAARGVIDVRKQAKEGDEVIIVGRVGGAVNPFTPGRATFLIVDPSLKPAEACSCPWDYCESPEEELAAARATVKFVDSQGKTLQATARDIFGIKELTTVVVKGKARREEGNLTVVADGIFVRKDKD
jgi:hypothetical protein